MTSSATLSPLPRSPTAGRSVPSVSYETYAPRSTAQVARLSHLAALTAGPLSGTGPTEPVGATLAHALAPPALKTESWSSLGDDDATTMPQAERVSDHLAHSLKHATALRYALRASLNIAEDLSNRHADLIRHTSELSAAADRLQEEEELLTRHAMEIGTPLKHYDAVDRIGVLVGVLFRGISTVHGLAKIKVDDDEFPALLDEIDQAVGYFEHESGGRGVLQAALQSKKPLQSGNVEYFRRALALQEAALSLLREAVADRIATTCQQIVSVLDLGRKPVKADQLEASLIYTRFHGISSRSHRLLALVKARVHQHEAYAELLQTCRQTYCVHREKLLAKTVRAHMEKLQQEHGPVGMTRLASVFLIRLCTVETSLYLDFFGADTTKPPPHDKAATQKKTLADDTTYQDAAFQSYLTSLCSALHRTIRRGLVTMLDLDTLCQIVSVLREERSMATSSPTTLAAARAISSVIQDAQERVIFCANTTLTKHVARFKATPKDLDYPDKLQKSTPLPESDSTVYDENAAERHLEQVYESWFPPMRVVLRVLSKIFRVVEPAVFEDMALTAVQACTRSLKDGATYIRARKGTLHGDLFLVKHLLILREQLSPFDMELRSVERQLDFSDAGKAVARFLANRNRRLFSMSTENALVTLLREGVSIQESSVDSKRDLEDALRSACNDFIAHAAQTMAADLLQLLETFQTSENVSMTVQSYLQADSTCDLLERTVSGIESSPVRDDLALYLDNVATQSILLKPVSRKITRATEDLRKLVAKHCQEGINGWTLDGLDKVSELLDKVEATTKQIGKHAPK